MTEANVDGAESPAKLFESLLPPSDSAPAPYTATTPPRVAMRPENVSMRPEDGSARASGHTLGGGVRVDDTQTLTKSALSRGLRTLRRTWWIFAILVLAGGAGAYVISSSQAKKYRATSALSFQQQNFDSQVLGNTYVAPNSDPTVTLATNQALVSLPAVAARAAIILQGKVTPQGVASAIQVNNDGGSSIETVTATSTSPRLAARLADAYATAYVYVSQQSARQALTKTAASLMTQIRQDNARGGNASNLVQLQTLLDRVNTVSALQTGGAQVVETAAVPQSPFSPRPARDAAFGAVFGLLLAIVIVSVSKQMDRRVREVETLEHLGVNLGIGHGILGTIQTNDALRGNFRLTDALGPVAEGFRLLRARLRYLDAEAPRQVMMVVSGCAAEGKSTIAFYLAATYAAGGARVLLIETDLRRPQLNDRLGRTGDGDGLAEYLSQRSLVLNDVLVTLTADREVAGQESWAMDFIPAGGRPPNPAELLQSPRMVSLLAAARARWDIVIVDTVPIGVVSDAIPLLSKVDGVIVVARLGKATRESVRRLARDLTRTGARSLGIVANGVKFDRESDSYGYGGYGQGYINRRRADQRQADGAVVISSRPYPEAPA